MQVRPSSADLQHRGAFEAGHILTANFHHIEHLRLAYVYLWENDTGDTLDKMRQQSSAFWR